MTNDAKLRAAKALGQTVLRPEATKVLDDYRRLTTDEQRAQFADHFLGRSAGLLDEIWPTFYQLLKRVEDEQLYLRPSYVGRRKYGSFQEYFEDRVGRPFRTWAQMEATYHYAQQYAPGLLSANLKVALAEADAADKANERKPGRPSKTETIDNIKGFPSGTSQSAALRRLRNQAPELHARVLNGELSPHAAMIEAGFRPKTFTVRADDPARIAATLRRNLTPHVLDALIKLFENG